MRLALIGVLILLGVVAFVGFQAAYIVDETQQAIVLQFGEPVGGAQTTPGLKFKTPFVQNVLLFDNRVLSSDADAQEYLTTDLKRLVVDHVTRWRITDPLRFLKSVGTEARARARLDDIVSSELRKELATVDFVDVISGERENIMDRVGNASQGVVEAENFGIAIIDVRIKRADLPSEVELSVYNRMQAERQRESSLFRSEGDREALKITSEADVVVAQTLARANRESRQVRGRAEAKAIQSLAEALQQDPEFYAFLRSLETYELSLDTQTTLVLSSDSDLFSFLTGPEGVKVSAEEDGS